MYDIAIIGAGPAGAMLARLAGERYRVLVVDRRDFGKPARALPGSATGGVPIWRPGKSCGGLVAPDAQRSLASLGVGLPRSVLTGPQLFVVRTIDVPRRLERFYQRHYINVDRERFDRWLVSLIPDAVDARFAARLRGFRQERGHVELHYQDRSGLHRARARLLVGADGACSAVRRRLAGAAPAIRAYIAVQDWFECRRQTPYFSALFDPQITDFYAWTIPKGDYLLVGAALAPGRGVRRRMATLERKLRALGFEWGDRVHREGAYLLRPRHVGQLFAGRGRVALIGEAAGWVSPSSAEGFSYAFASAQLLARSIRSRPGSATSRYRLASAPLIANIALKNLKSPFMYASPLRSLIMRSGLSSVPVAGAGECR